MSWYEPQLALVAPTHARVPLQSLSTQQSAVSLPGGHTGNGLPVGFQCAAAWGRDEQLLEWSRGIEKVLRPEGGWRRSE